MDVEKYDEVTILKALMKLNNVTSITVEYSGSGDGGCVDSIITDPELKDSDKRDKICDIAESLMLSVVDPNFDGCGSSGEMIFKINDEDKLVMEGDHHDFYESTDTRNYEVQF